jgi:hypothetical protein
VFRFMRRKPQPPPEKPGVFVGSVVSALLGHDNKPDPYGLNELKPERPMLPLRRPALFGRQPSRDSFPQPRR